MSAPSENVSKFDDEDFCVVEATVATGFENVAKEDAIEKLNRETNVIKGRIIITLPIKEVNKVLELEGVDKCYVLMTHIKDFQFSDDELESMRRLREVVREVNWELGLTVWKKVYSFKHPILSTPEVIPESIGEPTLSSRIHKPTKGDNQPNEKQKKGKRSRHRGHKVRTKGDLSNESDIGSSSQVTSTNVTDVENPEIESKAECSEQNQIVSTDLVNEEKITEKVDGNTDSEHAENKISDTHTDLDDEHKAKKQRVRLTEYDPLKPAFRVTCNRNGENHSFDSMGAASNFGGAIYNYFHWNVDMKNFDIEVVLTIEENEVRVSLALTKESLHKRNLISFGPTTLRPTISYNLLRLCDIKPGDVVCDPMCGSGSIPVQAAISWPGSYHIAGEISNKAIHRAWENINHVSKIQHDKNKPRLNADCIKWDVCKLPFKDNSIDVFATDLPFGVRIGSKTNNWKLYPATVQEMARVCRLNTGRACLLTQDRKCITKVIQSMSRLWKTHQIIPINLGGLAVSAYLLHRTSTTLDEYLTQKMPPQQE